MNLKRFFSLIVLISQCVACVPQKDQSLEMSILQQHVQTFVARNESVTCGNQKTYEEIVLNFDGFSTTIKETETGLTWTSGEYTLDEPKESLLVFQADNFFLFSEYYICYGREGGIGIISYHYLNTHYQ